MLEIVIDPDRPDRQLLGKIADVLKSRQIAALPTDTFYALATDPFDRESVEKIFFLKGREVNKPVILLIQNVQVVFELTIDVPKVFRTLAEHFWPGPLTLLMRSSERIPVWIGRETGKIGLRVPSSKVILEILGLIKHPLTGTSANASGYPPAQSAQQVKRYFAEKIDLIVDAGILSGGKSSTLLDITSDVPVLLREGQVKKEEIEGVLHATIMHKEQRR